MIYLSHEFSMENLLSFVEFLQFQRYVADKMECEDVKGNKQLLCNMLILPDTVPLSEIVHDESIGIKKTAYLLYEKYIDDNAIYMINIPFRAKQKINKIMQKYKVDIDANNDGDEKIDTGMLMVFDGCCEEMQQIMQDSYGRYKLTPQYHNIVSNILFV